MSNRNKGWRPWARDFASLVFGYRSEPIKDHNPEWTRKCRQARRKNQRTFNKVKRWAKRNGFRHP